MFTEKDVNLINDRLREDGIDFEVSLSDGGRTLSVERLEFGGCEDQDGAMHSVLRNYFRNTGRNVRFESGKVREEC